MSYDSLKPGIRPDTPSPLYNVSPNLLTGLELLRNAPDLAPRRAAADRPATPAELARMRQNAPKPRQTAYHGPELASPIDDLDHGPARPLVTVLEAVACQPVADLETPAQDHDPDIRIDRDLARLSVGTNHDAEFCIWATVRYADLNGCGWLTREALEAVITARGITYSDRQLRRILAAGEGLFWHVSTNRQVISLYSGQRAAVALVDLAQRSGRRDLFEYQIDSVTFSNLPGSRPIYVSLRGGREQVRAEIYNAWLTSQEGRPISRAALCRLFGVTKQTLWRWEALLTRAGRLTVRPNDAQYAGDPQALQDLPEHAYTYTAIKKHPISGKWQTEVRLRWQTPNSYITHMVREHPHRGQARKIRAAARIAAGQPAELNAGGEHRERCYYEDADRARRAIKHGRGRLHQVWLGVNLDGRGIWERTLTGDCETHPNERAAFLRRTYHRRCHRAVMAQGVRP